MSQKAEFKGLITPQKFAEVFACYTPDDVHIDGYNHDGGFHLVPTANANSFFAQTSKKFKNAEFKEEMEGEDAGAFIAVWNVDTFKPGYSLVITGVTGGYDEEEIFPCTDDKLTLFKGLVEGKTCFSASDAHMDWPSSFHQATDAKDWRAWSESSGEVFRIVRSLTRDNPDSSLSTTFNQASIFDGKTVVFTGTLSTMKRDDAATVMEEIGAKVTNALSAKTDFLIVGADAGSKLKKAEKLGTAVLTEAEWLDKIKPSAPTMK